MLPDFHLEDEAADYKMVCGIDEVGRGPWAGPVCAACVVVPADKRALISSLGLRDSKKLSAVKRNAYAQIVREHCAYAIAWASVDEIDALNIRQATFLAMRRAYEALSTNYSMQPDYALIDGRDCPDLPCKTLPVIKGDDISLSISAASVIAKVARDSLMQELHTAYPAYLWNKNAGYGVKAHRDALQKHGVTPHHRKSFAPIRKAIDPQDAVLR